MRISDWSSDVCASDLEERTEAIRQGLAIANLGISDGDDPDILADSKQLIEIDITGSLGAGQQHQRKSLFLRLGERPNFVIDHKRLMDEMRSNLIQIGRAHV